MARQDSLRSKLAGKDVVLLLTEGPLDCKILGVFTDLTLVFYECRLEDGTTYLAHIDDVNGITIKNPRLKKC